MGILEAKSGTNVEDVGSLDLRFQFALDVHHITDETVPGTCNKESTRLLNDHVERLLDRMTEKVTEIQPDKFALEMHMRKVVRIARQECGMAKQEGEEAVVEALALARMCQPQFLILAFFPELLKYFPGNLITFKKTKEARTLGQANVHAPPIFESLVTKDPADIFATRKSDTTKKGSARNLAASLISNQLGAGGVLESLGDFVGHEIERVTRNADFVMMISNPEVDKTIIADKGTNWFPFGADKEAGSRHGPDQDAATAAAKPRDGKTSPPARSV